MQAFEVTSRFQKGIPDSLLINRADGAFFLYFCLKFSTGTLCDGSVDVMLHVVAAKYRTCQKIKWEKLRINRLNEHRLPYVEVKLNRSKFGRKKNCQI